MVSLLFIVGNCALAETDLAKKLSGRILLQVQSLGQAWYVNPLDLKRYYLGRPADAFNLMRQLGVGITNQNLAKIATISQGDLDKTFAKNHAGKIFLQTESAGQAWYVNPLNLKRYYLGRPADAFNLMSGQGLGIREDNLTKISIGYLSLLSPTAPSSLSTAPATSDQAKQIIDGAASAIRSGDTSRTITYFTPGVKKLVEYTMVVLNDEGRLSLGNMMSATTLKTSTDNEKTYSTEVYVAIVGNKVEVKFYVKKQPDGSWLIANL